jgi:hypothetical protein
MTTTAVTTAIAADALLLHTVAVVVLTSAFGQRSGSNVIERVL